MMSLSNPIPRFGVDKNGFYAAQQAAQNLKF